MKYRCLTYRELDLVDDDFREFLYENGTNKFEWNILNDQSHVLAMSLLEEYSDRILEQVLEEVKYINYFRGDELLSYHFNQDLYGLIRLKFLDNTLLDSSINSLTDVITEANCHGLKCSKAEYQYKIPKKMMCFQLIENGAKTSDHTIYDQLLLLRTTFQN